MLALRRFLEAHTPTLFDEPPFATKMLDTNIVFRLEGEVAMLHQRDAARGLIAAQVLGDAPRASCMVRGTGTATARTIKGVEEARSLGAALVSFDLDAFTSYGKAQGDNADKAGIRPRAPWRSSVCPVQAEFGVHQIGGLQLGSADLKVGGNLTGCRCDTSGKYGSATSHHLPARRLGQG
jgi:hypothetical protein